MQDLEEFTEKIVDKDLQVPGAEGADGSFGETADKEAAAKAAASSSDERAQPIKVDGEGLRVSPEMKLDEIEDPDGDEDTKVSRQVKRLNETAKKAIAAATDAAKTAKKTTATPPRGRQKVG